MDDPATVQEKIDASNEGLDDLVGSRARERERELAEVSRRDADCCLALVEADIAAGKRCAMAAGRTTVGEWAEQWFATGLPGWKPRTRHTYRSILDPWCCRPRPDSAPPLRPIQVKEWVGDLAGRLSAAQARQACRPLSQVLASAVDKDMIPVPRCTAAPEADPHILTVHRVAGLADVCAPGDRVLVLLLADGACGSARRCHFGASIWTWPGGRVVVEDAVTELPGGPIIGTPKDHP